MSFPTPVFQVGRTSKQRFSALLLYAGFIRKSAYDPKRFPDRFLVSLLLYRDVGGASRGDFFGRVQNCANRATHGPDQLLDLLPVSPSLTLSMCLYG